MQWTIGPWCEFVEAEHIDGSFDYCIYIYNIYTAYIYIIYIYIHIIYIYMNLLCAHPCQPYTGSQMKLLVLHKDEPKCHMQSSWGLCRFVPRLCGSLDVADGSQV